MVDWSSLMVISETLAYAMAVLGVTGLSVWLAHSIVHRIMDGLNNNGARKAA